MMHGQIDFLNGIYFAFICLTAIEYGDLVPDKGVLRHFVLCVLKKKLVCKNTYPMQLWKWPVQCRHIGSYYVRKLHYIGRKLRNIANIRIWFGAKNLQVKELITAVGQNIGISEHVMADIDLEHLIHTAIQVKMGRLSRVPQTHMIIEGIWPPELVPLFMKDGQFPLFVDSEDDLLDMGPKKTVVRFQDDVISDIDDTTSADRSATHSSRLSPVPRQKNRPKVLSPSFPDRVPSRTGSEASPSLQDTTIDTVVLSSE
ncbi:hypothetical protein ANCCEY_13292 [Ancylostoma ceylanicum]|uniref:Potassium channel domain-containing protein n=1 Tax=Ancylostoma ceylanicum TaxID=53326 RepID=A0A0D6L952_9BILA|nr:hypothetical protein ANCCEY_13292 [Ancylostoma ceylanicum]